MSDYDPVISLMKELDIPITRQNFIDVNWFGDPPEKWDAEAENQIPPELQDWSWLKMDASREEENG